MKMDGQQSTHGESYAYTSPYWAEFYDMWVEDIVGPTALAKDDEFFFSLLWPFLSKDGSIQSHVRVVDMATGTGRVIRGILQTMHSLAQKEPTSEQQSQLEIWGIDHSQAMVDRAKSLLEDKPQSSTTLVWRNTTAANFVDQNPELENAVDLIICAAGSIGHLTAEGERKRFLEQVAKALRETDRSQKQRSVAAISVLTDKDRAVEKRTDQDIPEANGQQGIEMRKPSRRWPHLEYRMSRMTHSNDKERSVDSFHLTIVESTTGKLVSQETHSWSLKVFDFDEWENELSDCGLIISRKFETRSELASEVWYILQLADN